MANNQNELIVRVIPSTLSLGEVGFGIGIGVMRIGSTNIVG